MTNPVEVYRACVALGSLARKCVGGEFDYAEAERLMVIIDSADRAAMLNAGYEPDYAMVGDKIYNWKKTTQSSLMLLSRHKNIKRTARSVKEQTGWQRLCPKCLCDVQGVFEAITEYDFDLLYDGFIEYLKERGVCAMGMSAIPIEKEIDILHNWTDEQILTDPLFTESATGYIYTEAERRLNVKRHRTQKGKMQDAWEIFLSDIAA